VDDRTKLVLVNSPHNPTGTVVSEADIRALEELASKRGAQLVVDEVYHPIYRGSAPRSAGEYTRATVLGDFSKAFSLPGIRVGWILERDPKRREDYWNARAHFSISNNFPGELLAEVAARNRRKIFDRAREVAESNLKTLDVFFREHRELLGWVRPEGGMTAFPWLVSGENARPFCEAAAAKGVLLAPGDCFGFPSHFRLGFGACAEGYEDAVEILSGAVTAVS
jgi:aspartate/methionine/tyrosine aminotransferase